MDLRTLSDRMVSTDDVLRALGLEQRRTMTQSMASASAWFGAGMLIGAGLAFLLAPGGMDVRGRVGQVSEDESRPLTQM